MQRADCNLIAYKLYFYHAANSFSIIHLFTLCLTGQNDEYMHLHLDQINAQPQFASEPHNGSIAIQVNLVSGLFVVVCSLT